MASSVLSRMKTKKGSRLFNDARSGTPRVKGTGYGTQNRALKTLKKLRGKPRALQVQIATTMYYRAKYHKYQTQGMRNAMKIYKPYLKTLKRKKQKGGKRAEWLLRTTPAYPEIWENRAYPLEADRLV